MQLSKRLKMVADNVTVGNRVADIGCDHAYISIYLIQNQIAPSVIAMDINEGPLLRAKENIRKYGMEDKIEIRLSDGAKKLQMEEADTILIGGMGGALIVKILSDSLTVIRNAKELVLQPQAEIHLVRKYLHSIGFGIADENMTMDEGKYYTVIKAVKREEIYEKEIFYLYGKLLLQLQNSCLKEFLVHKQKKYGELMKELEDQSSDKSKQRLDELKQELESIQESLSYFGRSK